jgi:hypothetical protein
MSFSSVAKNLPVWSANLLPQSGQVNWYTLLPRYLFPSPAICFFIRMLISRKLALKAILRLLLLLLFWPKSIPVAI